VRRKTSRLLAAAAVAVPVVLGPLAGVSSSASPVVSATSSLSPAFVTAGRTALYEAGWTNESNAALTNATVVVTLPAGTGLVSADPAGCTVAEPAGAPVVSCPKPNLASGDTVRQRLLLGAPASASADPTISANLTAKESRSDGDRSHDDTFEAPDRALSVVPTGGDAAGSCLFAGDPLQTGPGLTATNPLVTTADLTGPSGLACAGLTVVEQRRSDPAEACGAGATCTEDISVVEAPASASPYRLTFAFVANNRNLTWYKNGLPVPECRGATQLPAGVDACVTSRAKTGSGTVAIGVLWSGGPDPSWTG
jgi:uncharacterized repeat protein (TIGR01451 family)